MKHQHHHQSHAADTQIADQLRRIAVNERLKVQERLRNTLADYEKAVQFQSRLPVKHPSALDKFLYWLAPNWLRNFLKKVNNLADIKFLRKTGAFDGEWYLRQNSEIADAEIDPIRHYVEQGESEGRNPSPLFVLDRDAVRSFRRRNFHLCYYAAFLKSRRENFAGPKRAPAPSAGMANGTPLKPDRATERFEIALSHFSGPAAVPAQDGRERIQVLFIGHEVSKTGAPIAFKQMMTAICKNAEIQPWFVSDGYGSLYKDFGVIAPSLMAPDWYEVCGSRHEFIERLGDWFRQLKGPKIAVCNTIVTRDYISIFSGLKIPVIAWIHELATSIALFSGGETTMKKLAQEASSVVLVSELVRQSHIGHFNLKPDFGTVIHNGVALSLNFDKGFRQRLSREWGVPEAAPLVLGCGSIEKRKGVDIFVQTAKVIQSLFETECPAREKPHFVWIGGCLDKDFLGWCQHDAKLLGLADNLHFVGSRDDLPDFYRSGQVFLMTSREDPFPLVTMEAMGYGLPVIAFSGATGQEELLVHGGILVPYLNSGEMASSAYRLMVNPQAREEMGRAGCQHVQSHYTWDDTARNFLAEIRRVLGLRTDRCGKLARISGEGSSPRTQPDARLGNCPPAISRP